MKFSFLFSGRRPPTHPGCHQELSPHKGRPPEVPYQGLRGLQLLSGRKSGKNIFFQFCQKNTE